MRSLLIFLSALSITFILACGGGIDSSSPRSVPTTPADSTDLDPTRDTLAKPGCSIEGEILEGNQNWIRAHDLLVAILADSATNDPELGASHRILEIYNSQTCERIDRQILPVNVSPDFPYYLARINYNNDSQILAIRGFDKVYLYDMANQSLLPALEPAYSGERYGSDAQSGMIQRVELWEQYLVGAAQDMGIFVFDLSDRQSPQAVMPFAEYEISETDFGSLFLLGSAEDNQQIIMPSFNMDDDEFAINPLFERPKKLNTEGINTSARNNRYLVIREANEARRPVAVDLQKRQLMNLPTDIAGQQTQEILEWMRGNG